MNLGDTIQPTEGWGLITDFLPGVAQIHKSHWGPWTQHPRFWSPMGEPRPEPQCPPRTGVLQVSGGFGCSGQSGVLSGLEEEVEVRWQPSCLQTSVLQMFTKHPLGPVDVVASKPAVSPPAQLTEGDETGLQMGRASRQEADSCTRLCWS